MARIDTGAINANVQHLRAQLSGGAELCAVVKADGYGHGIEQVAKAAVAGGATRLAVVTAPEAERLAGLALGLGVIVLAPTPDHELERAVASGAELTVFSPEQVAAASAVAERLGVQLALHVKLDTGMGRFGARREDVARATLEAAAAAPAARPVAVWTHFATADERGDDYFPEQLARFTGFVEASKAAYPGLLAHAANSAALLRDPASHFDFARAGIAIYGLDPFGEDAAASGLVPALSLRSYVASVREVARGESVGYGRRFTAERDTLIATIPIGYGDGWPRILSNNCDVLIDGVRHPQRGTISMDSVMVELAGDSAGSSTNSSTVQLGTEVTLIGSQGGEQITAEEVATRAQTINYEITCGLTPRTLREYAGA